MSSCINKSLSEYQMLAKVSGIPSFVLDAYCSKYLDQYDRFPYLDELPNANSQKYLLDILESKDLNSFNYIENTKLLEITNSDNVEDAIIKLNNLYRDLTISIDSSFENGTCIKIEHRANLTDIKDDNYESNFDKELYSKKAVLNNMLDKLKKLYGINIIKITSKELSQPEFINMINDAKTASAFIFNNNIYINTDIADIDAPIHELFHIILGSMRYTDPELYNQLLEKVSKFNSVNQLSNIYQNRTQSDLLEEVFVKEFSNFIVGNPSEFSNFDKKEMNLIFYNVFRNIDSMLSGKLSVKSLQINDIFNSSLVELAELLQSPEIVSSNFSMIDLAEINRKTSNYKTKLLENGDLIQNCE